jgi:hypothetical protein
MMINSFTHRCIELGVKVNVVKKSYDLQEIQNEARDAHSDITSIDIFIGRNNEFK